MLKLVAPAFGLAILAQAVLASAIGLQVRLATPEAVTTACRVAPGFQSARLWQGALTENSHDEDTYVREMLADARAASNVRSAVARFKAELQDRALAEAIDKRRMVFVPGRLTLAGCTTYAAYEGESAGFDAMFPAFRVQ